MALKIKTEEDYQSLLAQIKGKGQTPPTPCLVDGACAFSSKKTNTQKAKAIKTSTAAKAAKSEIHTGLENPVPVKRKGVKEMPILTSLRDCSIEIEVSPDHMTIAFKGARLFTLNEIYAMLQYRSYVVFAYKKQWHELVLNALRLAGKKKPSFLGPCKVTLFRQGSKKVDRDSLMVMFKYIIDALKHDPKKKHVGLFDDDNPDIVYDDEKIQTIGEPIIGIRIEQIALNAIKPDLTLADLFDRVPQSLIAAPTAASANSPSPKKKRRPAAALKNPEMAATTTPRSVKPAGSHRPPEAGISSVNKKKPTKI